MNLRVLAFALMVLLILCAGAALASFLLHDSGYVLVVWQGWQMQTSVGLLLLLMGLLVIVLVLFLVVVVSLFVLPARRRQQRKSAQNEAKIRQLEQATLYRVLDAPEAALDCLQMPDNQPTNSIWSLLKADLARQAGLQGNLSSALDQVSARADDVAVLVNATWLLDEGQLSEAKQRVAYLLAQPASGLRANLEPAFSQYLQQLWLRCALYQPWAALLDEPQPAQLALNHWQTWLNALVERCEEATPEQQQRLLWHFDQQPAEQQQALVRAWLKLLRRLPDAQGRAWRLAVPIITQQFRPELLDDWLRLAAQLSQTGSLEGGAALPTDEPAAHLLTLSERFVGHPAIRLAQARWYDLCGQSLQAEQWAAQWPTAELLSRLLALRALDQLPHFSQRVAPLLFEF